ncbi:Major facilitator superfamily domain-containing protein 8 [Chionoecetes opilio]|uniref:Major facilitator superfamily domain-containing protein 8 n=1 Tax=Chionoecetes opilio TaxID=41210 RepID=A0A8J4YFM0_CHIOP|nr:Major facilitator superfamily domain-containing protein 8 [Chionoecetes opilio]
MCICSLLSEWSCPSKYYSTVVKHINDDCFALRSTNLTEGKELLMRGRNGESMKLPTPDPWALAGLLFGFFITAFIYVLIETLAVPFVGDQYGWSGTRPSCCLGPFHHHVRLPHRTVHQQGIYSKVRGPPAQGLWMGVLTGVGGLARIAGPIFVAYIYTELGTYWCFGVLLAGMILAFCELIALYPRLVPMKLPTSKHSTHRDGPAAKPQPNGTDSPHLGNDSKKPESTVPTPKNPRPEVMPLKKT